MVLKQLRLQVFVFFHKVENGSRATKQKLEEQALLATDALNDALSKS